MGQLYDGTIFMAVQQVPENSQIQTKRYVLGGLLYVDVVDSHAGAADDAHLLCGLDNGRIHLRNETWEKKRLIEPRVEPDAIIRYHRTGRQVTDLGGASHDERVVVSYDFDQFGFRHGLFEVHHMASLFENLDANLMC